MTAGRVLRQHGFTLLEVMIALVVIAVALAALVGSAGNSVGAAAHLRDKSLAHWVALNRIAELRLERAWPEPGRTSGRAELGDRDWFWQIETATTEDELVRRIEIGVRASRDQRAPLDSLTAYLPRPDELAPESR